MQNLDRIYDLRKGNAPMWFSPATLQRFNNGKENKFPNSVYVVNSPTNSRTRTFDNFRKKWVQVVERKEVKVDINMLSKDARKTQNPSYFSFFCY